MMGRMANHAASTKLWLSLMIAVIGGHLMSSFNAHLDVACSTEQIVIDGVDMVGMQTSH